MDIQILDSSIQDSISRSGMWAENHILISDSLGGFDPGGLKSPGLECGMWVWGCKCRLEEKKSGSLRGWPAKLQKDRGFLFFFSKSALFFFFFF